MASKRNTVNSPSIQLPPQAATTASAKGNTKLVPVAQRAATTTPGTGGDELDESVTLHREDTMGSTSDSDDSLNDPFEKAQTSKKRLRQEDTPSPGAQAPPRRPRVEYSATAGQDPSPLPPEVRQLSESPLAAPEVIEITTSPPAVAMDEQPEEPTIDPDLYRYLLSSKDEVEDQLYEGTLSSTDNLVGLIDAGMEASDQELSSFIETWINQNFEKRKTTRPGRRAAVPPDTQAVEVRSGSNPKARPSAAGCQAKGRGKGTQKARHYGKQSTGNNPRAALYKNAQDLFNKNKTTIAHDLSERRPVKRSYVCPPKFIRQGHRCYYFSKDVATWQEAMFRCRDMHSNIAIIKNAHQDELIRRVLSKKSLDPTQRWLGGVYDWQNMTWKWAASGKLLTYSGFPESDGDTDKESLRWQCIIMDPSLEYK
ncbi:unnamed protein product [Phaedon cochleariae]|uniref:C-type lectin domain-containing protein n=1 Tax=Phaedon cochleariae TaxID=80249 RepID=A0A9N9X8E9_PHACE|nr:unnamed protein product [Phaedon cochleariae]